jgi:hypothetical protein
VWQFLSLIGKEIEKEKAANDRKIVMSAAANLEIALRYESAILDFAPRGDGVIGHDFNLEQAREFMRLSPQARDALQNAIENSRDAPFLAARMKL